MKSHRSENWRAQEGEREERKSARKLTEGLLAPKYAFKVGLCIH
jgi:hypothetical protein